MGNPDPNLNTGSEPNVDRDRHHVPSSRRFRSTTLLRLNSLRKKIHMLAILFNLRATPCMDFLTRNPRFLFAFQKCWAKGLVLIYVSNNKTSEIIGLVWWTFLSEFKILRQVCDGIFKHPMGAMNRVGIGLSYRPLKV
jgi:hypothetical protein